MPKKPSEKTPPKPAAKSHPKPAAAKRAGPKVAAKVAPKVAPKVEPKVAEKAPAKKPAAKTKVPARAAPVAVPLPVPLPVPAAAPKKAPARRKAAPGAPPPPARIVEAGVVAERPTPSATAAAAAVPAPEMPATPSTPTELPPRRADGTITLAHSPDADDAFMFYALAAGRVDTEDRKYEHVLKDIQSLNEDAKRGTFDVTAISFHAYPYVRGNYRLLTCGASFGDGYGPMLVAKTPIRPAEVEGLVVAIPGELTTAALVTRMWFGRAKIKPVVVPFDKVIDVVQKGLVRAGVIIHEAQVTYKQHNLVRIVDFGQWWAEQTEGLPLPLGGNGIRRDIPKPLATKIALDLKRSIAYALGHREEALAHAMKYARDLPKEKADQFVAMYVNDLTLDYGERGRQAVAELLDRAYRLGLLREPVEVDYVTA